MRRRERWVLNTAAALMLALSAATVLAQQEPVTIVYPIHDARYPQADPANPIRSYYQPFSFSVVCSGSRQEVEWGIDQTTLGRSYYSDQFSTQFVMEVSAGEHQFWVRTTCGRSQVRFLVAGKGE